MPMLSVETGVAVPGGGGTPLAADVIRPSGPGSWPAVVVRTPYDRTTPASRGLQVNALALAEAGYAVVVQDVRGRYGSEGVFEPFVNEATDGVASIEWVAEQSWCSGRVGTAGISYLAYTQQAAAVQAPEPLGCWIPGLGPCDVRTSWVRHGDLDNDGFNRAWIEALGVPPTPLLEHEDDRIPRARDVARATAPALVVAGHYDVFHHGSHELFDRLVGTGHRLVAGPWGHTGLPLARRAGDRDHGADAIVDLHDLQLAWFDLHLRDHGKRPPNRVFFTGSNHWEGFAGWPPPGESIMLDGPPGAIEVTIDPNDPTPAVGGRAYPWEPVLRPGAFDQARRRVRDDVIAWSYPGRERVVAGQVRCQVDAAGPGYVVVTLSDIDPDGRCWNIGDGAAPIEADGPTTVDLGHVFHEFTAGHDIGIDVSFAAVPRFPEPPPGNRTVGSATHVELAIA